MTVSLWHSDTTSREVDFLVVGAGLVGCTAAYFAAQQGRQVTITDASEVGMGASSRNAGFLITGLDAYYHKAIDRYGIDVVREIWALSRRTHGYLRQFIAAGDVPVSWCGSMLLAESEAEAHDLELAARALQRDGIEVEFHSRDPLGRGYFAAIEQAQDAAVQPYQLVHAIFQQSGAELVANNPIYRIEEDETGVGVYARRCAFRAQYVLLCTNAYSIEVDPYFIGKVIPTRGQILVTAPLTKGPVLNTCGYSDYGFMYYRDTFDGRLLIGGGRKQNKWLEHNTTEDRVTAPVQRVLEHYLKTHFPDVDAEIERRWAGIMGFTVDGLPLVGTLPGKPRVGFAVGFNGHGLALGAGSADLAVEMLLKNSHPGAISSDRLR
jgi:glycine/D-amino acid oxidase-like deaminating enzyme